MLANSFILALNDSSKMLVSTLLKVLVDVRGSDGFLAATGATVRLSL